ncbi:MAG: PTS transporter subunit EIIC [Oligoflexia bacterium]|nr:PTS transporter subunit EIIC [Oligoflexia bacterium]
MLKGSFAVLQQVGKSLMLPVAILPAAGMLLAFGNAFQNPETLRYLSFLNADWIQLAARMMEQAGGVVFSNLALLFAIGVAVGLSAGEGVAGLAATVGFLIMNVTMGLIKGVTPATLAGHDPSFASVLGIPTLQTGVFGGIIIGVVAAKIYNSYHNVSLPSYLGFFAGKRFVPIVTAMAALVIGVIMSFVWPYIQGGLSAFSHNMIEANLTLSAFVFGVIERALIPFGLHHIFYNPFWFQFGSYMNKAGHLVNGDQAIFFAQLKDGVAFTAGTFMGGKFPFMMFGLPAAALAIYQEAAANRKKVVAGIMLSAALTSFLTGITEPIEFTFLFVAPVLFGIHCIFAGLSFMTMHILNVKIGMTFSGGVIDYILFGVLPNRTQWWLVIPIGLVLAVIYYFGFRFAIRYFDLKTPGREDNSNEDNADKDNTDNKVAKIATSTSTASAPASAASGAAVANKSLAREVLARLGGGANIISIDACITRLRIEVKDSSIIDKAGLKSLGAAGVLEVGNSVQVVFGPKSDQLREEIKQIMNSNSHS